MNGFFKEFRPINVGALLAAAMLLGMPVSKAAEPDTTDLHAAAEGNNAFASDLYARLAKAEQGNLFFSPYSITTALAMTYAGARGETATEMAKALHFTLPQERLHPAMGDLILRLNAKEKDGKPRPFQLSVANSLWAQKGYPFEADYLALTKKSYGAGLQETDFAADAAKACDTINTWIEDQTNKKIKDMISGIPGDTKLVLVNAIYFLGDWKHPFAERNTKPGPFHLDGDKQTEVPFMKQVERFKYHEEDQVLQLLELPYKGQELSMLVLLPSGPEGLAGLERDLTPANITKWSGAAKWQRVSVTLPKFKMTWGVTNLVPHFDDMGMKAAFKYPDADFSGMAKTSELFIGMILHKAFVDVNEKGTEAAAATAVVMRAGSAMPALPVEFKADRPFVFMIRDNASGSILFMGRVSNPKAE